MEFTITKGEIRSALKVVVYGPEGIGKSTFAARFPDPLFIDTEGSTKHLNVGRLPKPTSWDMLREEIQYVIKTPGICRTLVIDTIDWAEQLCIESVCARSMKSGIEDFGYGKGYVYVAEEIGKFLRLLDQVIEAGIHVCLNAHAAIRKFEQPDEMGAYDRYELKLGRKTGSQTAALVKEWADIVLFANYKTYAVSVGDDGKKKKARGGKRVMYTSHHPCWDAKNRYGLPEETDFDFQAIGHLFQPGAAVPEQTPVPETAPRPQKAPPVTPDLSDMIDSGMPKESEAEPIVQPSGPVPGPMRTLLGMMQDIGVVEREIQSVVAEKGYYPHNTPIGNYDPGFIDSVLIGAWDEVVEAVMKNRQLTAELPWEEKKEEK